MVLVNVRIRGRGQMAEIPFSNSFIFFLLLPSAPFSPAQGEEKVEEEKEEGIRVSRLLRGDCDSHTPACCMF